jgi:hypothetical protein
VRETKLSRSEPVTIHASLHYTSLQLGEIRSVYVGSFLTINLAFRGLFMHAEDR